MKLFKLLTVTSIVVLSGCARQLPAVEDMPQRKAPMAAPAPKPVDPSLAEGPTWKLSLEAANLWHREQLEATSGDYSDDARVEFLAETDSPTVVMEVLVGDHTEEDLDFIRSLLQTMSESDNVKLLKVKQVQTASGEPAALVLSASMGEDGPVLTFRLITSKNGHGYVVACGGVAPDDIRKAAALCLKSMETFEIKDSAQSQKKAGPKPVKMPKSTPESTQTRNDTSL